MPLSATLTMSGGRRAPSRSVRRRSTEKSRRSRAVDADDPRLRREGRVELALVVDLDERGEPRLERGPDQRAQLGRREDGGDE
jgi:hypothetical protein